MKVTQRYLLSPFTLPPLINRKLILIAILFLIFMIPLNSYAGWLIEPFIGKSLFSSFTYDLSKEDKAEYDYSVLPIGTRLGYKIPMFASGLTYYRMSTDLSGGSDRVPISISGDHSGNFFGIFFSGHFPLDIVFRYTYFISSRLTNQSGSTAGNSLRGDGFAIGGGYSFFSYLTLNLEYIRHKYDVYKTKTPETRVVVPNAFKSSEWLLSLSFPYEF
jgi:hypothetical protein